MKILVAGDFCPQFRVATIFEDGHYQSVLGEAKQVICKADYSIVNLECPITIANPEEAIKKLGPHLCCSIKGLEALQWAGFKCVTLANNHFMDYGKKGVENTLKSCSEYRIDTVGGGLNLHKASNVLYKNIEGNILAIINCCEHEFSIATENTPGCSPLNPISIFYAINEAKAKANYILVIVHGGHEHFQLPSPRMVEIYRFFIDAGADAIINHHQHCFSGYEVYNSKPIFYGLGNFCFDGNRSKMKIWNEGYMVMLDFKSSGVSFELYPYLQCLDKPIIEMLPVNSYDTRLRELNSIIARPASLQDAINKYYTSCSRRYSNIFEPIQSRLYLAAKNRGWLPSFVSKRNMINAYNYINCESHRDKVLFYLNQF